MKTIGLIGHSASGKSAILEALHLDRKLHDFDVYLSNSGKEPRLNTFIDWIKLQPNPEIFALSNQIEFLEEIILDIERIKRLDIFFVYLKRDINIIRRNLRLINTDGHLHPVMSDSEFNGYYHAMDSVFTKLCDVVLDAGDDAPSAIADNLTHTYALSKCKELDRPIFDYHFEKLSVKDNHLIAKGWILPSRPIDQIEQIDLLVHSDNSSSLYPTDLTIRPDVIEYFNVADNRKMNALGFQVNEVASQSIKGLVKTTLIIKTKVSIFTAPTINFFHA